MSEATGTQTSADTAEHGEIGSMLFAQLVVQQSNMAMMLMGKVAHPESGKVTQDLEAARLFIDQLEMLEAKTKGNLSKEEEGLLKQTLMSLRFMYVEAVESAPSAGKESSSRSTSPEERSTPPEQSQPSATADTPPASPYEEEHRKKFSKKY